LQSRGRRALVIGSYD
jgi:hypothetical protein